ncbi:mono/diheme cytochrome c family protein [Hasllibacter halocynthiae]|uniref:Mono/diheme cytochrome c family protein n=1 Tax=Hasllibacter halocynthiae TaxID=595589 RepID=A0A2T0X4H3_9RHOB|nr:cytochrome c [Hasllibacter halocynthiae]PRY93805.1 mono/diheme cytochrome c family protein [Hasllibacter halocynthiae]
MRRLALLVAFLAAAPAVAQQVAPDPELVEEGRYLAVAADCAGCHGTTFAGGDPVPSPIGAIYASNITPDPATGIGGWTLEDFAGVLREGDGPDGHIYPAMPYTSYTGLADREIAALWSFFMLDVEPVERTHPDTDLGFPFYRWLMPAWNLLFLDEGEATGAKPAASPLEERGRELVETLGHCGACHTPRGQLMQQLADRHLGGAMLGGWWAPNITTGPGGVGDWEDEELARFLATGHSPHGVAGGEMGTVVSRSLSHLPEGDIAAIVAYLRAVPPVASDRPAALAGGRPPPVAVEVPADDWAGALRHDTDFGAQLYQAACSSCHGIDGRGSPDGVHPSLLLVTGQDANAANLVQVIAHGIDRTVHGERILMPGFRDAMSDEQIASVANYVRTSFGGAASDLDAGRVSSILAGGLSTPWLISNAPWLAGLGLAAAGIVLLLLIVWLIRRPRRRA